MSKTPDAATGSRSRWEALKARPLFRRVTGYSAGSLIAAVTSEAAFAATLGWGHTGTTVASAAGFVGGAVPNYFLNRRWAWKDRRGRSRRQELLLYALVSIASFLVSAVVTDWAEDGARTLTSSAGLRVALVALTYLGVSAVFFVGKFVAYELVVFTRAPRHDTASGHDIASGQDTASTQDTPSGRDTASGPDADDSLPEAAATGRP